MIKFICGILAIVLMASAAARAADPVGIEVRKRSAIGRLGVVHVQVSVKPEADGSMTVSFQAPGEGTYVLVYTSGPNLGKTAARINVSKPGPVTTKIRKN
jgi:hypothetical protein